MGIINIIRKTADRTKPRPNSAKAGPLHQHRRVRRPYARRRRRSSGRKRVALALPRRHLDLEPGVVRLPVLDALQQVAVRVGRNVLVAEDLDGPELETEVLEVRLVGGDLIFSVDGS